MRFLDTHIADRIEQCPGSLTMMASCSGTAPPETRRHANRVFAVCSNYASHPDRESHLSLLSDEDRKIAVRCAEILREQPPRHSDDLKWLLSTGNDTEDSRAAVVDCFYFDGQTIQAYFFEFGHLPVEMSGRLAYKAAVGAALFTFRLGDIRPDTPVRIYVIQPHAYHSDGPLRSIVTSALSCGQMAMRHRDRYELALSSNPPTKSGPECRRCPHRRSCATLAETVEHILDYEGAASPVMLTGRELGAEVSRLTEAQDRIKARLTGLTAQLDHEARQPDNDTGWSVRATRPTKRWSAATHVVLAAADAVGVDLRKPAELITPTQALKLIDGAAINDYIESTTGEKLVYVSENDPLIRAFFRENI